MGEALATYDSTYLPTNGDILHGREHSEAHTMHITHTLIRWLPPLEFLSKILYRQVPWFAALFCRTSPEQAKIPQNRPNFRVLIFLDKIRVGGPPPLFWSRRNQNSRSFPAKNPFLSTF